MIAILRREFNAYFSSALGYAYLAAFYFFTGYYFFAYVVAQNSTDLTPVFSAMFMIVMLLIPILTMRLMSEDKRQKTDQALLTAPVSLSGLVYGKFLAAFIMFALGIGITLVYGLVMSFFAAISWMVVIGNLVGILLMGAGLISIGLFISSLTDNQIVAAVGAFVVMLVFMYVDVFAKVIPITFISDLLMNLSFMGRYYNFTSGLLNIADVLYFISVAVIFNFLTVRVLEKKRWS